MKGLTCNLQDHHEKFIEGVCVYDQCQKQKRLCCSKCLYQVHQDHINFIMPLEQLTSIVTQQQYNNLEKLQEIKAQYLRQQRNMMGLIQDYFRDELENFAKNFSHHYVKAHEIINTQLDQIKKHNEIFFDYSLSYIQFNINTDSQKQLQKNEAMEFNRLGTIQHDSENYVQAIKLYEQSLCLFPFKEQYWRNKGNSLYKLERYQEALYCIEMSLHIKQDYVIALIEKSKILNKLRQYSQALQFINYAINLDKLNFVAWNVKGNILHGQEKYMQAYECYDYSLKLKKQPQIYENLGGTLEKMGKFKEAIKYFKKALQMDPGSLHIAQQISIQSEYSKKRSNHLFYELYQHLYEIQSYSFSQIISKIQQE